LLSDKIDGIWVNVATDAVGIAESVVKVSRHPPIPRSKFEQRVLPTRISGSQVLTDHPAELARALRPIRKVVSNRVLRPRELREPKKELSKEMVIVDQWRHMVLFATLLPQIAPLLDHLVDPPSNIPASICAKRYPLCDRPGGSLLGPG